MDMNIKLAVLDRIYRIYDDFEDVLLLLATKENRDHYKMNTLKPQGTEFIPNLQITVLMIPPEHRIKIKPLLDALMRIKGQ